MTTTIGEVYFLVRVGSWGEDELEDYIQERVDQALEESHTDIYESGYKEGHEEGLTIGAQKMYEQAFQAIKDLS